MTDTPDADKEADKDLDKDKAPAAKPDEAMHPVDPGAAAQKEGAEDQKESSYS